MKKVVFVTGFIWILLSGNKLWGQLPQKCLSPGILETLSPPVKQATIELRDRVNQMAMHPKPSNRQFCNMDSIRRVPVVFHVIHHRSVDSISADQIATQMTVLYEDFRKVAGTPGNGGGVDCRIEFYLAAKDPAGDATTGITYTNDSMSNFTYSAANDTLLKSIIIWPQSMYLNIWVVDTIMYGGAYLLGYAHFPSNGTNILDGIVIADQYVGRDTGTARSAPYTKGRTLTHEIGHYFGLYHPFDYVTAPCEGNAAADCATAGDFVCDVPPTTGHYGCPIGAPNTCNETPVNNADLIRNYMEYVDDNCMDMFTAGQRIRMINSIDADASRSVLTSTINLFNTGVMYYGMPDAFFMFTTNSFCTGNEVLFQERSLGTGNYAMPAPDVVFAWSFQGGTPDTSNARFPIVYWEMPDTYVVALTVTNNMGFCTHYIPIIIAGPTLNASATTVTVGTQTDFTGSSSTVGNWTWEYGDGNSGNSPGPFIQYTYATPDTFLYIVYLDPADSTMCTAKFRDTAIVLSAPLVDEFLEFNGFYSGGNHAHLFWTTGHETASDYFKILRSFDGEDFQIIGTLPAAGNSSGQLKYTFEDLAMVNGKNYYKVAIVDIAGGEYITGVIEIFSDGKDAFILFPNPARERVELSWGMKDNPEDFLVLISDLSGRIVMKEKFDAYSASGTKNILLNSFTPGCYLMELHNLKDNKILLTTRLVVE